MQTAEATGEKLRPAHFFSLLILTLVATADGFDLQAAAMAAPGIASSWGLERLALTPMLTAGFVGIFIGAPLAGWLGDRYGRKPVMLAGVLIFSIATLACAMAKSVEQIAILRFFAGIGLGGALPNTFALASELAPPRWRPLFATICTLGVIAGSAIVAFVAGMLAPGDWPNLFLIGGGAPLVIAAAGMLLKESPEMRARETAGAKGSPFEGAYRLITPLVCCVFVCTLMTIYLVTSWLPLMLQAEGAAPARIGGIVAMFQVGGIAGSLIVAAVIAKLRFASVALMAGIGVIAMAAVSLTRVPLEQMGWATFACGLGAASVQTAVNSGTALLYPPHLRARGLGWGLGVGRLGSIGGPLVGGALLSAHLLSTAQLLLAPIVPLSIAVALALYIAAWERKNRPV